MARRTIARKSHALLEALENRTLLAAALPGDPYGHNSELAFGQGAKAIFVDANGDIVTVSLTGAGIGAVRFVQATAFETGLDADSIYLAGTGPTSVLLVKVADTVAGDTDDTGVQQINVDGSLNVLAAPAMNLSAGMTASGTLGKVALKYATGTISVQGSSANGSSFAFAGADDLTLNSPNQGITAIKAEAWYDDGAADRVSAPYLGKLRITNSFEPQLTLSGSMLPANGKVLGSASIGSGTQGNWQIHGNAGSIRVGYFGGDVTIDDAAASVKTGDYVGLLPDSYGGSHTLTIGANGSVKTPDDRIRFQGGATLYTHYAPVAYNFGRITGYDQASRRWYYYTTYSGALGSGTTTASSWIETGTNVYNLTDTFKSRMNWSLGGSGPALEGLGVNDPDVGNMYLGLSSSGSELYGGLPARGTVGWTAYTQGTWTNPFGLDATYGPVQLNLTGTATISLRALGHQEVEVPYGEGRYLAYKLEMKVVARGPVSALVMGEYYSGNHSISQTLTVWCVPGIGVVKQQGAFSVNGAVAGEGGSGSVKATMWLTNYTG